MSGRMSVERDLPRTLVIGDVHGCSAELAKLLDAARPDRAILVGDLFTKGPDPAGVLGLVRERGLKVILGNHDQRLLEVRAGGRPDDGHGHRVADTLDTVDRGWVDWLGRQPIFRTLADWVIVHAALHPSGDLMRTDRRTALVLRRWPDDAPSDPRWWKVYEGPRRVVFGHDARQGLLMARPDGDGRPRIAGLDTGCVYGGQLTGMWLDDCSTVQVEAARAYKPIS